MNKNWRPWKKPQNCQELIQTLDLLPTNWSLTPLREKRAFREGWQNEPLLSRQYFNKLITSGETKISKNGNIWQAYISGYGLRTGTASGCLLAIDFDGASSQKIFDAILGLEEIEVTISWTSGNPGRYQLLFQVPQQYQSAFQNFSRMILRNYQGFFCKQDEMLEFRYNRCQSALPPSYHPETGGYMWINPPWKTPVAFLPDSLANFLKDKQPSQYNGNRPSIQSYEHHSDETKVISALYRIDPDCPYHDWLKVGMALKSESDRYLDLWDSWSSRGSKYKPKECERKWRSFRNLRVSVASLFYLAKLYR